jgi:Ubiquitin-activating enzyme E1 FCCH domain
MTYSPFLISNYATGLDRELQPWLLPNDAFVDLLDGFVYRGVTRKRDGYSGFANGLKSTYTESRMVHTIGPVAMTGAIDAVNMHFTATLTTPVSRGSVTINGSNPVQVLTDNGLGVFTGNGTGTINYTTGAVAIDFTAAPLALSTVTITADFFPGLPVMGVMSFYPVNNVRQLIVADTRFVNRYNPVTDRLEDISTGTYSGTKFDFWSWTNYATTANAPRLLFANGVVGDVIQQYDGTTVAPYTKVFAGGTLNARQIFNVRDRLVLFQTIEAGVLFPRRIRISGTGVNSDTFDNTAPGAGFIDIPDNTWFFGAAFNRDDVVFFTEGGSWLLKYTGNDITPFTLQRMDDSRGSGAAFSVITYLNRTMAASPRGLIISDGYQVERMDNNIPDFSFNNIDNANFQECFSGFIDEDRDVYLIYPSQGVIKPPLVPDGSSDRILVINFEEDNYAIYRIPLSCMGNFQSAIAVLWSDLTTLNDFPDWDALSETYSNWNSFPYTKGTPIAIGGGHKGEIWRLNDVESEDNPQKIRAMTVIDSETVRVTTDWNNYNVGDNIVFEDVGGMIQINHQQAPIKAIQTAFNVFDVTIQTTGFSAYTSGGIAAKTVPFEALSKKLNPWVDQDKKVRCGWIYFYVSVTNTILKDVNGVNIPAFLDIDVITNDTEATTAPQFQYRVDCSNLPGEIGSKQWVKIWINQTAKFLQFRMKNNQAGAKIQVHAMMPGFQPQGRLV